MVGEERKEAWSTTTMPHSPHSTAATVVRSSEVAGDLAVVVGKVKASNVSDATPGRATTTSGATPSSRFLLARLQRALHAESSTATSATAALDAIAAALTQSTTTSSAAAVTVTEAAVREVLLAGEERMRQEPISYKSRLTVLYAAPTFTV